MPVLRVHEPKGKGETMACTSTTRAARVGCGVRVGDMFVTKGASPLARRFLQVVEIDGDDVIVRSVARVDGWSPDGRTYGRWPVRDAFKGSMTFRRSVRGRAGSSARPAIKVSGTTYVLLDDSITYRPS